MADNPRVVEATRRVFEILEQDRAFVLNLTQQLTGYKSINPRFMTNPEASQEAELQHFLEGVMRDIGLETTSWEAFPHRPNLVGRLPGQGPTLIFNGHIDVVPPGNEEKWRFDPWGRDLVGGRLYGRGTYDMKGGVAAFVAATKAIREAGITLNGPLELHVVVDEEAGGAEGTRSVIEKGYLGEAVIVAEPTDGAILPAEGGLSWL